MITPQGRSSEYREVKMAKLTVEQLVQAGLTEEAAKVVLGLQEKPKAEREVWFRAQMTQAKANEITSLFPEVVFSRPIWKKAE
jgi:hypothetical protein